MGMSNKTLGTYFEKRVCAALARRGYWVHFLAPDARGAQPFDIIAVKNGTATAIECKTLVSGERWFPASRLEENQRLAFAKWKQCWNGNPCIVVYRGLKGAVWFPYDEGAERYDLDAATTFDME